MIIYKLTNKLNGKIYIGQTVGTLHVRLLRHVSYGKWPIQRAIRKYGIDAFDSVIVDTAATQDELNRKEQKWIALCDCMSPKGYNLTAGGGGISGWKATPEFRAKISKANKGRKRSDAFKQRMREMHLGKHLSPEHCAKLSAGQKRHYANTPRKPPKQYIKVDPALTHEKRRLANLGRRASDETRRKQSELRTRFRFDLATLAAEYRSGETAVSLAAKYGCSDDIIAKNLRAAGLALRNQTEANLLRYKRDFPIQDICRRYSAGESLNRLAIENSCSVALVTKLISESGVPLRHDKSSKTQTHCKRSHEYTPENLIVHHGNRSCRECRKMASRKCWAKTHPQSTPETDAPTLFPL
jgi:group I intron endonuclease